MIPSGTSPKVIHLSGGPTFSVAFPTFEKENVIVQILGPLGYSATLAETTNYTLSNIGKPNSNYGVLTLMGSGTGYAAGALLATYSLQIKFKSQAFQPVKLRDLGRYAPEAIEKAMDRIAMSSLALRQEQVDYSAAVGVTAGLLDGRVTSLEGRATTVEGRATTLEGRATTVEGRATALEGRATALEGRATAVEGRATALEATTVNHAGRIATIEASAVLVSQVEFKATNFNATYNKIYVITAAVDVQLPVPIAGGILRFKLSNSLPVNLLRNAAEEIDFVSSNKALTSIKEAVTLVTDGTDWFII